METDKNEHEAEKQQFLDLFKTESKRFENEKQTLLLEFQNEKQQLYETFENKLSLIEDQNQAKIDHMEQSLENEKPHYLKMKRKYESREPRKEDIAKIDMLEEKIKKQQLEVEKSQKDLKRFQLELLNREENYNKVFGRSPTVGLMTVGANHFKL